MIRAVVHMIGSSDREEVLSQLCAALGGWGLVYGHTHEPHVSRQRVIDPLTGEPRTVLLGNCGSFRRKSVPPTWIESDFPHLELWAFNVEEGVAEHGRPREPDSGRGEAVRGAAGGRGGLWLTPTTAAHRGFKANVHRYGGWGACSRRSGRPAGPANAREFACTSTTVEP